MMQIPSKSNYFDRSILFFERLPPSEMTTDGSDIYFAVGYPDKLTKLDADYEAESPAATGIKMAQVLTWAERLTLKRDDLPMLHLKSGNVLGPLCGGDLSGFSGGPVFSVSKPRRIIEMRGIAIRGAHDKLFFVEMHHIDRMCDWSISQQ